MYNNSLYKGGKHTSVTVIDYKMLNFLSIYPTGMNKIDGAYYTYYIIVWKVILFLPNTANFTFNQDNHYIH